MYPTREQAILIQKTFG
ncbi:MAG: helix-turn-helix domain-containing protein, partial [Gracilibacteraceae bacterium]|nr:helix-turn-helix domain-containing protein [Gracilibacteraceae bacterium]